MTVIYSREDLNRESYRKTLDDIRLSDLNSVRERVNLHYEANVILFRDNDGRTKVFKDRFGHGRGELVIEVVNDSLVRIV